MSRPRDVVETAEAWQPSHHRNRASHRWRSARICPLLRTSPARVKPDRQGRDMSPDVARLPARRRRATIIATGSEASLAVEACAISCGSRNRNGGCLNALYRIVWTARMKDIAAKVLGRVPRIAVEGPRPNPVGTNTSATGEKRSVWDGFGARSGSRTLLSFPA